MLDRVPWVAALAVAALITSPAAAQQKARARAVGADVGPVWAEPDPAAVIGRWRGGATWKACAAGAGKATLDVARDGSGYRVDLAPVLDGLGAVTLVPAAARKLETVRDDLTVVWTTGKHNRATLEVRFASGCTGTLRLTRDGTGVAACDELAALEVLGAACATATLPPISPADRTAIAGAARAGAARGAATRTCTRHVAPVRTALVEVGCVPAPAGDMLAGVRLPECEALLVTVSRLMRCDKVPVDVKERLHASMQRLARSSTVSPGEDQAELRARAAETCSEARGELANTMTLVGCQP